MSADGKAGIAAQPSPQLPSVFDLGRLHQVACTEKNDHDRRCVEAKPSTRAHRDAEAAMELAGARAEALGALIFAQPANTIADALTLAVHGRGLAELIDGEAEGASIDEEVNRMRRAFARIAVVLSRSADIPLATLDRQPQLIWLDAFGMEAPHEDACRPAIGRRAG